MIKRFREATHHLHQEIEKENLAAKIMDHSVSLEEYKLLLLQNYIAYKITEEQIIKFLPWLEGSKHLSLKKDLDVLNIDTAVISDYENLFYCDTYAEALGAAYVVEGSALGGMVISKELKECEQLSSISGHNFFNGDRNGLKSWTEFKKKLGSASLSEEEADTATEKALETFRFFREVFKLRAGQTVVNL